MVRRKARISLKPGKSRAALTITHPNAAGIDIGSASHFVAVPPDRDERALTNRTVNPRDSQKLEQRNPIHAGCIVAGERDGQLLGSMKNARIHASVDEIAKSLHGNWRAEHLFALKQSRAGLSGAR